MANGPLFWSSPPIATYGVQLYKFDFPKDFGVTSTHSNILAAATEVDATGVPFIGDASIQILNIAPGDDSVKLYVNTLWDSPINVRLSFVIWP